MREAIAKGAKNRTTCNFKFCRPFLYFQVVWVLINLYIMQKKIVKQSAHLHSLYFVFKSLVHDKSIKHQTFFAIWRLFVIMLDTPFGEPLDEDFQPPLVCFVNYCNPERVSLCRITGPLLGG